MRVKSGGKTWGYFTLSKIKKGQKFYCEANTVVAMSSSLEKRLATMSELKGHGNCQKGFWASVLDDIRGETSKRIAAGEDLQFVVLEAVDDEQKFTISPHFPGMPLYLEVTPNTPVYAAAGSFLIAETTVEMNLEKITDTTVRNFLIQKEYLQKFVGNGNLWLEVHGEAIEIPLDENEEVVITPGHFLAYVGEVSFSGKALKDSGLRKLIGHDYMLKCTAVNGPATVYTQSACLKEFRKFVQH